MGRKKPPPDAGGDDIPMWFMTYSDVITLMMTFFILLLTFATSEPERFEQMKISMFGASGANGLVGKRPEGAEKDDWTMRVRPRQARMIDEGSEVPPVDREAAEKRLDGGLSGLDEDAPQVEESIAYVVPGTTIATPDGQLFDYGLHYMAVLTKILNNRDYELSLEISSEKQLARALSCIYMLYHVERIRPDRLMLCHKEFDDLSSDQIRFRLRYFQEKKNGQTREEAPQ